MSSTGWTWVITLFVMVVGILFIRFAWRHRSSTFGMMRLACFMATAIGSLGLVVGVLGILQLLGIGHF